MTDPRDDIDAWLHAEVEPLRPPPGTFERIRKQARRRKARRAVVSAASAGAAAALIVLAVVALPRVVPSMLHLKPNPAGNNTSAITPARSGPPHSTPSAPSSSPATGHTARPAGTPPVPSHFAATSVTFIGQHTGWVIGQAGTPGRCFHPYDCTSVARTDDAGRTWYGVPAPVTGAPDGGTGVSQIRFLDELDGWAFGPALWATHDGGRSWARVPLGGRRVLSLETTGSEAFAVLARCSGTGARFAAGCTRFWLYSSPAGRDDWAPVPSVAAVPGPGGAGSAAIVLTSRQGYWYTPDGMLLSGPVSGTAPWTAVSASALPCLPGAAAADGRPAGGQLAAPGPGDLVLACPGGGAGGTGSQSGTGGQQVTVYASADGGSTWAPRGQVAVAGTVTSLAAGSGGQLALACSGGTYFSADNGTSWQPALVQAGPPGGFSYVGLTSPSQGVAVPAAARQHAVWFTFDGGRSWRPSPVRSG